MSRATRFSQRVVLITGASAGIGRATALAFAREGALTVLIARSRDRLEEVAEEVRALHSDALVVPTDVSAPEQVRAMVDRVMAEHGRIDVLFNNAGSALVGPVAQDTFVEDTQRMMAVDFYGTVQCTKAVLPVMQRQASGHIVNMSSVVGRKAFPHLAGYSATMHAIAAFSDALRQELDGTGIHVSVIHPALTETALFRHVGPAEMPPPFRKMTPLAPEIVAESVLDAVARKTPRVVLPAPAKRLLLADAVSPRAGDRIVRLMSDAFFARLIGIYRGTTYGNGQAGPASHAGAASSLTLPS